MKNRKRSNAYSRRAFLAGGAMLGAQFAVTGVAGAASSANGRNSAVLANKRADAPYDLVNPENIIQSVCLQCNTGCGIKCKLQEGVLTKIDGNPYNPWTLAPHIPFETPIADAATTDGAICPKGQAGLQTAYDPYRIRKVLKRAGKRGENKWVSIPFADAIREICDGGKLFGRVAGEEDREVEGLRSLVALNEPNATKQMAADVKAIWDEKTPEGKSALVEAFKAKYADKLDKLIDPEHPDFGPRNNQIVVSWGRLKGGRSEFYKRFATGLNTTNAHGHTTVCQGSLYFTCKAISEQYQEGKFSGGEKFYWQADNANSEFVLFVGANLFEGNYGPPNRAVRLTEGLASGKTRIAVIDPRYSKLASKSWKWLPAKPGTDAAIAMAIMRWMFDNNRIDLAFLSAANKAAANQAGSPSWSNATWLVEMKDGKPGKFVRAADVALAEPEVRKNKDGVEYAEKFLVAMGDAGPVAFDPNDAAAPVTAQIFVDGALPNGTAVKSSLQLLKEAAEKHTIEEWCEEAGVNAADVIAIARELTSHGRKAAVDIHRGPAQHTNGFYNVLAWMSINMLLGNFDATGGMIKGTTYDYSGKGKLFDLKAHPGKATAFGVSSIRHEVAYDKTTIFSGYPAKRNWYPLSSDIYQEIIPSAGDAYPYPIKALFMYMGAPTYALPAGNTNIEILCDTERIPLFVSSDILIGPTSMYADYIFPDLSFLERWEFQGTHPNMPSKVQPVRQPVISPIPENCTVYGNEMPLSFEAMILAIAEQLNLPGFGENGLGSGLHLKHPDDFYIRAVANLAFGEKPDATDGLPDADQREMELFLKARRHLPETVFSADRWKALAGEAVWPKVVYALNRGGRYENPGKEYKGDIVTNAYAALLNLYQEKTAGSTYSGTGKPYIGHAAYVPLSSFQGKPLEAESDGTLSLITHRTISQTKSRTIVDPWLTPIMPENGILINPVDAKRLNVKSGDIVRVSSSTNEKGQWDLGNGNHRPMDGKVFLTETIRPGVVSFALGFGQWAAGASDVVIDSHVVRGEPRRAVGVHANAAMWTDPDVTNTCLVDPVGGSVSFYDTRVRLTKVS
jgi:tetrathionate reductase subunit A